MSTIDIDSVGFNYNILGEYFDFYVNNTFYTMAPPYYQTFYSIYLRRCLSAYDGWINGWHNTKSGLVPQRMLQSIARGLNNMLFANGIDFNSTSKEDYAFAVSWAKKTKLYKVLKKAHLYAVAGGTSLIKQNRSGKDLFLSAHRVDTFFADISPEGNVTSVRVYYDAIHNTNPTGGEAHYGIFEERYFNDDGRPCVRCSIYRGGDNLQTEVQSRPTTQSYRVNWENLPKDVKSEIRKNYPSIIVDKEQYLPFVNSLGCHLLRFTDEIGQIPNTQFGQPIGDILFTENFQYDQMKFFEKNEVNLARARALVPDNMWNKDDPAYNKNAMSDTFYQKVSGLDTDADKITPIQFNLRGTDMKTVKENIYKDCAFKINVSASSIATFLSEGAGAKTATEIMKESTKSDTWIHGQININKPEIDDMLREVMLYYNHSPVEIAFKSENQSPLLETVKTFGDQLTVGNMSPEMFVRRVYKDLSLEQQAQEIEFLKSLKNSKVSLGKYANRI